MAPIATLLIVGLDAASSFELLSHLNKLADSNRTVILTIHQPRLEIFHMFHRLVLLSDGKVRGNYSNCYVIIMNRKEKKILRDHSLVTMPSHFVCFICIHDYTQKS
jgi:ABC-type multidrug transport system ATPase subunit